MPVAEDVRGQVNRLLEQLETVVAGNPEAITMVLTTFFSGGHLLIEDVPGVGKTTLAHALASSLRTDFGRIQFTADLLPADIVGVDIYDPAEKRFVFHPGPIFHHIVLADEINRATPKAQSALLEAMAEGQVTIERETRPLPQPFFVIATQNPHEFQGTFPLPESQLDRFFMRISLGYPPVDAERRILLGEAGRSLLVRLKPVADLALVQRVQQEVTQLHVAKILIDYVLELLQLSRNGECLSQGISPRAGHDLLLAAKTYAWLQGRNYVTAEDVQRVWLPCLAHRVVAEGDTETALRMLLERVPVPA